VASRVRDRRAENPHPDLDELLTSSPQPAAVFGEHLAPTQAEVASGIERAAVSLPPKSETSFASDCAGANQSQYPLSTV